MRDLLLVGGSVVDGTGAEPFGADLLVTEGRVAEVDTSRSSTRGRNGARGAVDRIDCSGRLIFPGFIDTHCHLDGKILDADAQLAVLRQGVTSVLVGQDGVSFAPGNGKYGTDYFASINGKHPTFGGGSVGDLLASYDGGSPVNVGYLIPQGTVRHNVMGMEDRPPTAQELAEMIHQVEAGMLDGALGMSTGLDYVPGKFASTSELVALCEPVRKNGGVYVSHLRGYQAPGVAEASTISAEAKVPAHLSHYHGPTEQMVGWLNDGSRNGADLSFDAYPYARGCTNLSLLVLPPAMQSAPVSECLADLGNKETIDFFAGEWLPARGAELGLDSDWLDKVEFTYIAHPEFEWAEGLSITAAARKQGVSDAEFIAQSLRSSRLEVGATVPFSNSGEAEAADLASHAGYMCGSDGIYLGSQPHPRGWGSFARVLAQYCRDSRTLSWGTAAWKLSGHPAQRFSIPERGRISVGAIADLAIVDPTTVSDTADYGSGRSLAVGIADVLVHGTHVLKNGSLTGALSGVGLRREVILGKTTGSK